ncbi:hypothetical protein pb186bvf_017669 [Paramecium bursaria]
MMNFLRKYKFSQLKDYQLILEGNKQYVAAKLNEDPQYFQKLSKGQQPKYLLIGCSDSRCPPNELTQTQPGEIFIHRNVANCVIPTDLSVNSALQFSIDHLKVSNIIVMGHTYCGGIQAALSQESVGGVLDLWLNNIKQTIEKNQDLVDKVKDNHDKLTLLTKLHIREQIRNLWKSPIVQRAWSRQQQIMIHGWLLKVETGYIEEIEADDTLPNDLAQQFNLKNQLNYKRQS